MNSERLEFIENMPKVELHLHLEGAIPLIALKELVQKYDYKNPLSVDDLIKKFRYKDFPSFLETWGWKNSFLREYEDFRFIASEVARDLADQNIVYVEAFYSPGSFSQYGLEPQRLTEAIREGLNKYSSDITVNLVADLIRDHGPDKGRIYLEQIVEVRNEGVIGIGIGGSEHEYPPAPYKEVYKRARNLGFHTSAHAGEAAGADSIWGAIKELDVERIGHGTRAFEDKDLIEYLIKTGLPLEMCPLSNVRTSIIPDLESHPIRSYFDKGLIVSINSDDPKMFQTSMNEEYYSLMQRLNFSIGEIKQLAINAIDTAWCNKTKKADLREELDRYYADCYVPFYS
jgi:adenosine deaminase